MPDDLLPVLNGYSRQYDFWVYDQVNDYYQRHLLLHEGTHAFMYTLLGGCGPPWFSEGIAELFGTHRWQDGVLTTRYLPHQPSEAPRLGRIEIVQKDFAAGRALNLSKVLAYDNRAHLKVEPYGWCWAAAAFLDNHPKYQKRFRELSGPMEQRDVNAQFGNLFADDAATLAEEWQLFVADIEYGYDFARCAIDFTPGKPLPASGAKFSVAADRGWQNAGCRVEAGQSYVFRSSGRFQLADKPKPWISEPGGVSIRYRHGLPLGIVLAAIRGDKPGESPTGLIQPLVIGRGATLVAPRSGTLYLRINDFPGELDDNAGSASVEIMPK